MRNKQWKCKRCGAMVDVINYRCKCTESPSPWEEITEESLMDVLKKIWKKTTFRK